MWKSSGATTLQCNTSASLAVMLEKEMSCYRRYPPNKVVPLAEYIEHRMMLIEWCNTIIDQGSFRAPNEIVQVAMALADKYMSMKGLYSYMKAHYQLIVVTCLSIAIKVDSRTIAVTSQELSELCRGEYTREEIESEEMCVLHALAWYVNPPTASQIANHILALVENFKCAQSEWDWAVLVDRVHLLIKASVLDLGLSTQMRPSTLALASILASTESLRDPQCRKAVLRSILSVTNRFDFTSPSEIDIVRTDLTFLQRSYSTSPSSLLHQQPQQAPIVQPANVLSASNSVFGSNVPANPSSRVAEDIPSNLHCVNCADANPSSQAPIQRRREGTIDRTKSGAVTSSQPPRQRSRAGTIGPTTYRRADSSSSESSTTGSSSDTATHFSSAQEGMKTALVAEEKSSKAFARLEQMLRDEADLAKRLKEKQIMLTEIEAKANEKEDLRQCQITQASQEAEEKTVKLVKTEANDEGNAEADSVLTGTLKQRQTTQTTPQKVEVKTPLNSNLSLGSSSAHEATHCSSAISLKRKKDLIDDMHGEAKQKQRRGCKPNEEGELDKM